MQDWVAAKALIVEWAGLDSGAVHTLASTLLLISAAAILRKPLGSWLPWLSVFVIEAVNETATAYADGVVEDWEVVGAVQDAVLVMAIPTILFLACRLAPQLAGRPVKRLMPSYQREYQRSEIIDAQFEEIR